MGLQTSLNISEGLSSFLKEDGMDANRAGRCHVLLDIVEEDDLCRLHIKALTGQFKNASLRLGNPYLMGVNDQVGHLSKMVALLLSAAGTHKAVAEDGSLIARAQAAEVGSQRGVEFSQILFPQVMSKCVYLRLIHPNDLS